VSLAPSAVSHLPAPFLQQTALTCTLELGFRGLGQGNRGPGNQGMHPHVSSQYLAGGGAANWRAEESSEKIRMYTKHCFVDITLNNSCARDAKSIDVNTEGTTYNRIVLSGLSTLSHGFRDPDNVDLLQL
jgi:hypothetical protein